MKKLLSNLAIACFIVLTLSGCEEETLSTRQCHMLTQTSEYDVASGDFTTIVSIEYGPDHSLTAMTIDNERHEVTLDDRGNVIRMVSDLTFYATELEYDNEDRLISRTTETFLGNDTFAYTYNATGQPTTLTWTISGPSPTVWEFSYEYPDTETMNPSTVHLKMGSSFESVYEYTYDDHPVPTGNLNMLLLNPIRFSENNITHSSVGIVGSTFLLEGEYEYRYNESGYPLEVTLSYSNGDEVVMMYEYDCD